MLLFSRLINWAPLAALPDLSMSSETENTDSTPSNMITLRRVGIGGRLGVESYYLLMKLL